MRPELKEMKKRVDAILHQCQPEIIELVFSLSLFGWGCWILNPLLTTFDTSPAYRSLVLLVPWPLDAELVWGALVSYFGLFQFVALILNRKRARAIAAIANCGVMLFLGANFQISNPSSPAVVWFCCFAWAQRWAYHRIR